MRRTTLWSVKMRSALLVALLGLWACGGESVKTSGASPATDTAWVAGYLPDGFVITSADELAGARIAGYSPRGEHDYQIRIHAAAPSTAPPPTGRDPRNIKVRGHDATLTTLTDEGNEYGFAIVWEERSDMRLAVEAVNGPTESEAIAVAEGLHSISDADWRVLLLELSIDTYIGRVDPTATKIEALRGRIGSDEYVLTALVPGGYPLGPDDRRLTCFHLTFRGETSVDRCPAVPVWARVGGQLFVFGSVEIHVTKMRATPMDGSSFEPFKIDTVAITSGPPARFYAAPLPEGACGVSVDPEDGGPGSSGTGPLVESGPDYTRCTGLQPGAPPRPPTTVPSPIPTN